MKLKGVGPARKRKLLEKFSSLAEMISGTIEEYKKKLG